MENTIDWSKYLYDTDAQRAQAYFNFIERDEQREERERRARVEAVERRERQEAILRRFYGAAAEITVNEFPGFTPFAVVSRERKTIVNVEPENITLHTTPDDAEAMISSTLLAHAMWGRAFVFGSKDFQMRAVACGIALGVDVRADDAQNFTGEEHEQINRMALDLAATIRPDDPRRSAPRSVQLWPEIHA